MHRFTRRDFLFTAGPVAAGFGVACRGEQRPNVLFIMSDDHAAPAIGAYGSRINKTPNIDRIALEGMRFDNCFVTNSICTPSRAAIVTGKYAHINGVKTFTPIDGSQPTFPKMFQRAGYYTAVIGKWHLMTYPTGFDSWRILPGQGRYHDPEFVEMGDPPHESGLVQQGQRRTYKGYVTDIITDMSIEYLTERPKDRPFLLFCHNKAPHDTWEFDEKHAGLYEGGGIPEPDNLFDDYRNRGSAIKETKQKIGLRHTEYPDETGHLSGDARKRAQYQEYMKRYLRCVASVDDNVGRLLDYLDDSGLARNTIVIYTSDQGFFLGEHGLYDKRFMYEESLRMPFLIRWPGRIEPGGVNDDIVLNVDFAPTLLDCASLEVPSDMQGRSFREMLAGRTPADWRTAMYYRYYFSHFDTEPHYGVRTRRRKLIYYSRIGEWELFDLERDPQEMENVYGEPAYAEVTEQLKATLARLREELRDTEE